MCPSHLGECAPSLDAELRDREVNGGAGEVRGHHQHQPHHQQFTSSGYWCSCEDKENSPAVIRIIMWLNIDGTLAVVPGNWKDFHSRSPEEAQGGFRDTRKPCGINGNCTKALRH